MTNSLGLDFGTTNTVIAQPQPHGGAAPMRFDFRGDALSTFRSALCFWSEAADRRSRLQVEAGPWAIQQFVEFAEDCRFMQSLKSFAASKSFDGTFIFGKRYRFEDLMSVFFEKLRAHAGEQMVELPRRLVVGRPVTYAGASADPELAMQRYRQALAPYGFDDIHYVYEPVAAAFFYASRLKRDATILVADFGGGTTDFSVMQFEFAEGRVRAHALAHSGVGVAGDNFDYRLIDNVVSPLLGKGSKYDSMGKLLDIPVVCYTNFARWNLLSVMKTSREFQELKQLAVWSQQPERLRRLIDLIESDHSYSLYKAVSGAKERLSSAEETEFVFKALDFTIQVPVRRSDFERWIAADLEQIEQALDEALRRAGTDAAAIDKVFLTGGTSFVPAVRRMFETRFGADKIESGDEFLSIANGLALIGEREDIDLWTVQPQPAATVEA